MRRTCCFLFKQQQVTECIGTEDASTVYAAEAGGIRFALRTLIRFAEDDSRLRKVAIFSESSSAQSNAESTDGLGSSIGCVENDITWLSIGSQAMKAFLAMKQRFERQNERQRWVRVDKSYLATSKIGSCLVRLLPTYDRFASAVGEKKAAVAVAQFVHDTGMLAQFANADPQAMGTYEQETADDAETNELGTDLGTA
ncbi:hypothetical protein ZTR_00930 [Talaromyces verruculosus]|nr:hypothetical protein ZTR_00930 [Talaromyces verruculosus]